MLRSFWQPLCSRKFQPTFRLHRPPQKAPHQRAILFTYGAQILATNIHSLAPPLPPLLELWDATSAASSGHAQVLATKTQSLVRHPISTMEAQDVTNAAKMWGVYLYLEGLKYLPGTDSEMYVRCGFRRQPANIRGLVTEFHLLIMGSCI